MADGCLVVLDLDRLLVLLVHNLLFRELLVPLHLLAEVGELLEEHLYICDCPLVPLRHGLLSEVRMGGALRATIRGVSSWFEAMVRPANLRAAVVALAALRSLECLRVPVSTHAMPGCSRRRFPRCLCHVSAIPSQNCGCLTA